MIDLPAIPATNSANPGALNEVAARLEQVAEEVRATAGRVNGHIRSGGAEFTDLISAPARDRAAQHEVLAWATSQVLAHGAQVTRDWAADVTEYLARRDRLLAERERIRIQAASEPTPSKQTIQEIDALVGQCDALVAWFEAQATTRGGQLRKGPVLDWLSDTGRRLLSQLRNAADDIGSALDAVSGAEGTAKALDLINSGNKAVWSGLSKWATGLGGLVSGASAAADEWEDSSDRPTAERVARSGFRGVVVGGTSAAAGYGVGLVTAPIAPLTVPVASKVGAYVANEEVDRTFDDIDHIQEGFEDGGRSGAAAVIGTAAGRLAEPGPYLGIVLPSPLLSGSGELVRDVVTDLAEDVLAPDEGGGSSGRSH